MGTSVQISVRNDDVLCLAGMSQLSHEGYPGNNIILSSNDDAPSHWPTMGFLGLELARLDIPMAIQN